MHLFIYFFSFHDYVQTYVPTLQGLVYIMLREDYKIVYIIIIKHNNNDNNNNKTYRL